MNFPTIKPYRLLVPSVLAMLIVIGSSLPAQAACKCPAKPGLKNALSSASMVIVGRVEQKRSIPLKPGFTEIEVTVLKRFKNDEEPRRDIMRVYTAESADNCGIKFQPGFEYLLFVTGNPAFYQASACGRTEVLENAQVDVHRLAKMDN